MKKLFFALIFATIVNASEAPKINSKEDLEKFIMNRYMEFFVKCIQNHSQAKCSDAIEANAQKEARNFEHCMKAYGNIEAFNNIEAMNNPEVANHFAKCLNVFSEKLELPTQDN